MSESSFQSSIAKRSVIQYDAQILCHLLSFRRHCIGYRNYHRKRRRPVQGMNVNTMSSSCTQWINSCDSVMVYVRTTCRTSSDDLNKADHYLDKDPPPPSCSGYRCINNGFCSRPCTCHVRFPHGHFRRHATQKSIQKPAGSSETDWGMCA